MIFLLFNEPLAGTLTCVLVLLIFLFGTAPIFKWIYNSKRL